MNERDKIIVIGASAVTGIGSIVKHIINDHAVQALAPKQETIMELTMTYDFNLPFQPPLTRRQRRELARKNKLISSTGQRI